ncbi:DEAD/DEAH box helicase [Alloiococcus sp. CFN-8]|uniref:DEAD/DEAH box helicase n=1 Tax=Alloiococcus sp. CFN-8 TaxID=3416081 RepID=UPI003CFB75D8
MEKEYGHNFSEEILKALEELGYTKPTEVQERVIPLALEDKDIVVQSQTGSGKTAAFGIPLCEKISWEENNPVGLVLTPTRELAVQVKEELTNIGRFKRLRVAALFGKQPFSYQERELKQKTHIAVGTPGRVLDHLNRGTLKGDEIRYLIIDEADELLKMGFIEEVGEIISYLPKDRVTMLFSATMPERIKSLCTKYMKSYESIKIESEGITALNIKHYLYEVKEDKDWLLMDITKVENPDSCIIFCNTKEAVDRLYNKLKAKDYPCNKLHGGLEQDDRLRIMKDFKLGKFIYLITTDVAGRGIDIDNVNLVVNYDIPEVKEGYVHRTGRTGRAGKEGTAITFINEDRQERFLKDIEEYIGFSLERRQVPSRSEVDKARDAFENKIASKPKIKEEKGHKLNKSITKLYFNGGKKKKLRAVDFVGAICRVPGITAEDIGIIDIQENITYVEILNNKGEEVLKAMKDSTVKGKQLKVQKAKN